MESNIITPILKSGNFSVLVAELDTGILLTTEFERHLGSGKVFWQFESLEKASDFINSELTKNKNIEFSVQDNEGNYLFTKDINGKR